MANPTEMNHIRSENKFKQRRARDLRMMTSSTMGTMMTMMKIKKKRFEKLSIRTESDGIVERWWRQWWRRWRVLMCSITASDKMWDLEWAFYYSWYNKRYSSHTSRNRSINDWVESHWIMHRRFRFAWHSTDFAHAVIDAMLCYSSAIPFVFCTLIKCRHFPPARSISARLSRAFA